MDESEFQELIQLGKGRAIIYARDNSVEQFQDVILDACLHCYSIDPQSEGTRADYMIELVNLLPDRQFYYDEVLKALPGSGDDWDAVQRFRFAACMVFDGDERAKRIMYASYDPGPKMGEGIAINFVQMDGVDGFLFAAAKVGALSASKPDEVDQGWLWMNAKESLGEQEARAALSQAAATDPRIGAYRLAAEADEANSHVGMNAVNEIRALSYEQLGLKLTGMQAFRLRYWGKDADAENIERAAHGLVAAQEPEEQLQHLRIFSQRPFPLDPSPLLDLSMSSNEGLAHAAASALTQITHPSVRKLAFRLVETRLIGRQVAIDMISQNYEPNDHQVVLNWFESESDREIRHSMQHDLRDFWDRHPEPASEVTMLLSLYENGPCSFCRERVVNRLLELDSLSESMREECEHDANDEVRLLVRTD
jgi:hypothetical protein